MQDGKIAPNNKYLFRYEFLRKEVSKETHSPSETFTVNAEELEHGKYYITFFVEEYVIFVYYEKARLKTTFNVTNRFNGVMQLEQNSTVRPNEYVSSQFETFHNIIISDKDRKLYDKAAYSRVFWFIDCLYLGKYFIFFLCLIIIYIHTACRCHIHIVLQCQKINNSIFKGVTDNLNFTNWYKQENGVYNVEALLELSYEPLPPPTSSSK